MNFIYPDFAFTKYMQFLLFISNIAVATAVCYWGTSLLLHIMQKRVAFSRKFFFSLVSSFFSCVFFTYAIAFINGFASGMGRLHLGELSYAATTPLPFVCFIYYFLGLKVLHLLPVKCISVMQKTYILNVCTILGLRIGGMIIPDLSYADPRGFNYLHGIFKLIIFLVPVYLIYRILFYLIKRLGYSTVYPDNISVKNTPRALIKIFISSCAVYIAATVPFYYSKLDILHPVLLLIIFCGCFLFSLVLDFGKIQKTLNINQSEHIADLKASIEEFRGLRHDFNNIIQTYGGFITIKAYDKLEAYHIRMAGEVLLAQNYMDFSNRISENPSFFYLLIKKLERAKAFDIHFDARSICDIEDVFINSLDFTRVMSIFLDNAIECAAKIPQGRVSFTAQKKPEGSKLFIISNDTYNDENLDKIMEPGYTTKEGHMGQGLAQVRLILGKYDNCAINFTCYKNSFTVYLELRPTEAICS